MKKRLLSLMVATAMLISLMGMICMPASATVDTEAPVLEISGIPEGPVVGEEAQSPIELTVPENAGYTAIAYWYERYTWDDDDDWGISISNFYGTFLADEDYVLSIFVEITRDWEGFEYFDPLEDFQVEIIANGGQARYLVDAYIWCSSEGDWDCSAYLEQEFKASQPIREVELLGYSDPTEGELADVTSLSVPEDAPYRLCRAEWRNNAGDTVNGQLFEEDYYYLSTYFEADEGYHFAQDCQYYIDAKETWGYLYNSWITEIQTQTVYSAQIDQIELFYDDVPPEAYTYPDEQEVLVPEDALYYVEEYWYHYDPEEDAYYGVDEFLPGTYYQLELFIYTTVDVPFAQDLEILINGEAIDPDIYVQNQGDYVVIQFNYLTDGEPPEPEPTEPTLVIEGAQLAVGQPLTTQGIRVTGDIPCDIEAQWYILQWDEHGDMPFYEPVSGVAQAGQCYSLGGTITPRDGYTLPWEIRVECGEEILYFWPDGDFLELEPGRLCFDFRQIIETVEFTGIVDAQIGQTATTQGIQANTEDGFTFTANWYQVSQSGRRAPFSGVFQDDTRYLLVIEGVAKEGYTFRYAGITVNGEYYSNCWDTFFTLELDYDFRDIVKTVDLTGLVEPQPGETSTTQGFAASADFPGEAQLQWYQGVYELERGFTFREFEGEYEAGYLYSYGVTFTLDEGYYFADAVTVLVDGEILGIFQGRDEFCIYPGQAVYELGNFIDTVYIQVPQGSVDQGAQTGTQDIEINCSDVCDSSFSWYIEHNDETYEPYSGKLEKGKFWLVAKLTPHEGWAFAYENFMLFIENSFVDYPMYIQHDEGALYLGFWFDYREKIDLVEVFDSFQPGVGVSASDSGLSVPEDANYTATGTWYIFTGDSLEEFDGRFQADQIYSFDVSFYPNEGYAFGIPYNSSEIYYEEDVEVYYNNRLFEDNVIINPDELTIIEARSYTGQRIPITQVDITINGLPETAFEDVFELPAGANYTMLYTEINEDSELKEVMYEDSYYFGYISIVPKEGYYFAPDVTVNVKVYGEYETQINTFSYGIACVFYGDCVAVMPAGGGDLNDDGVIDNQDVEYLLWYTLFPEEYPIEQNADYDQDSRIDNQDVEYLLWHTLFPEEYPLN